MKKKLQSLCGYLISMSAILIIFITVLDLVCFRTEFYQKEYEKYSSSEELGVSNDDLMAATTTLLEYIQGDRDDIVVEINLRGNEREAFNNKETMHMYDVKGLYEFAMNLRIGALLVLVVKFIYLIVKQKQDALSFVAARFLRTALGFSLIVGFLGVWAYVDFSGLWTNFHLIFFRNDLWLLNPATDFMIQMFPEGLFFDLVLRIVVFFLIPFVLSVSLCLIYQKKERLHISVNTKENV